MEKNFQFFPYNKTTNKQYLICFFFKSESFVFELIMNMITKINKKIKLLRTKANLNFSCGFYFFAKFRLLNKISIVYILCKKKKSSLDLKRNFLLKLSIFYVVIFIERENRKKTHLNAVGYMCFNFLFLFFHILFNQNFGQHILKFEIFSLFVSLSSSI